MDITEIKGRVALKQLDDAGQGLARIATLSAIDHDGDTYVPGAFGEQQAKVVAAHDYRQVPLGKARIYESGDEALAEFRLNLETEQGRQWHSALKFDLDAQASGGAPLQEWSYGFSIVDSAIETRDGERVRILKRLQVHEISPVVVGAGVGTGTLALKQNRPFAEQLDAAIAGLEAAIDRAGRIAALREKDGRGLSAERLGGLKALAEAGVRLGDHLAELERLAALADPAEAARQAARFEAFRARRHLPSDD